MDLKSKNFETKFYYNIRMLAKPNLNKKMSIKLIKINSTRICFSNL